jgi:PadR family transcriptional regulator
VPTLSRDTGSADLQVGHRCRSVRLQPDRDLLYEHISAYIARMRRKPGSLVPLEVAICEVAADLRRSGAREFHGFEIAKHLADIADQRLLTAYGTLYRALGRLEKMGLLQSGWEDPEIPARENRPGRRLYTLTGAGEAALKQGRRGEAENVRARARRRLRPA